jgi:hypothetical protein
MRHVHVVHALECDDRRDRTRPTVINAAAVVAVPVCGVEAETGGGDRFRRRFDAFASAPLYESTVKGVFTIAWER